MKVAVVKETFPGERRVALVPADVAKLVKSGLRVILEPGAGSRAGFADKAYEDKGAQLAANRDGAFSADIVLQVWALGANLNAGRDGLESLKSGQIVVGLCDPLGEPKAVAEIAKTGAALF